MLLSKQKNPYTGENLDESFLDDLISKFKYFIPKTLEEVLESTFNDKIQLVNYKILIDKLSFYINSI